MLQIVSGNSVRTVVALRPARSSAAYPARRAVRSICPMHRRIVRRRALVHSRQAAGLFDVFVTRFVFESLDSNCAGCWDQDYDSVA